MSIFEYKAKAGPDQTVDGEVTAESQSAAVARVEALGYIPVWVREKKRGQQGHVVYSSIKVKTHDVHVFTRQLSSLLRTGVPILRALRTIHNQTTDRRMGQVVADLEETIRNGGMLSDALAHHPRVFNVLYINMIRAGEAGGVVDEILKRLSIAQDEEAELRGKIQIAVAYPLLVLGVGAISIFVMLTFFMPRIAGIFAHATQALPWPTRFLLEISRIWNESWYWLVIPAVAIILGIIQMTRVSWGRMAIDRFLLKIPLVGTLLRQADLARLARTLALLLEMGVPIHRALELSAGTLLNTVLRQEVLHVSQQTILQGTTLAEGFNAMRHLPRFISHMIAVGEESGRLEDALGEIGRFYTDELNRGIRLCTTLLEPVLILLVGAVVGFIIFATLLPIFEIGQTL